MFLSNSKVQKAPDGHFGIIRVPTPLHMTICLIALLTKQIGGTSQLFSDCQFCVKASTASDSGYQNKELNLLNFELETLANRSTVCGPQISSMKLKNSTVVCQSS